MTYTKKELIDLHTTFSKDGGENKDDIIDSLAGEICRWQQRQINCCELVGNILLARGCSGFSSINDYKKEYGIDALREMGGRFVEDSEPDDNDWRRYAILNNLSLCKDCRKVKRRFKQLSEKYDEQDLYKSDLLDDIKRGIKNLGLTEQEIQECIKEAQTEKENRNKLVCNICHKGFNPTNNKKIEDYYGEVEDKIYLACDECRVKGFKSEDIKYANARKKH
jgi:hypothetical protein